MKIPVQITQQERLFYDAVIQMSEELFLFKGGNLFSLGFVTNMPRRMAASCIPAMKEYIQWSLHTNLYYGNQFVEMDEERLDEGDMDDLGDDTNIQQTALPLDVRSKYEMLLKMAESIGKSDSKYNQFKEYLIQLLSTLDNPQVIVFSFFVRTLKYLKSRLEEDGFTLNLITGETPLVGEKNNEDGRYEIIDQFRNKKFQILLSSDVGGEGLDFQFCQAMINYDLPYNPMKVEQRIGRIDQFGQKSDKVFIASMYLENTVDERIYELLYERIDIVHESIGMFEPILSKQLLDFQKDIVSNSLTDKQMESRTREISLAMERSKLELSRFEEQRNELLGEGEFRKLINGLEEKNDFLKPLDAAKLTDWFLQQQGSTYKPINEESGTLSLTSTVLKELETFTRLPGMEGSTSELSPLLTRKGPINVIFNGSIASEVDYTFLPPTGFWIKFILRKLEESNEIFRVFNFFAKKSNTFLDCGTYLIPIFEIEVEGLKLEHHLAMVPVNTEKEEVVELNFIQAARSFSNALEVNEGQPDVGQDELETWIDIGRSRLEEYMNQYVDNIRLENETLVSAQLLSLEKGSEARKERLQQMIEEHKLRAQGELSENSKRYIISVEARIENERLRTKEKIKILKNKQDISFSIGLVGLVLMEVIED